MHVALGHMYHVQLQYSMLHFGVAEPQYDLLGLLTRSTCAEKEKSCLLLDSNSVPWLVRPEPSPVSYWEVLIVLLRLLLTRTKIGHN